MNPEMQAELAELVGQLDRLYLEINSLKTQVDKNHPDALRIDDAATQVYSAISSLKQIKFGLESEFSYDD